MPSSWIIARPTKDGGRRYRVLYRTGGRESRARYAGSFKTKTEAVARKRWVDGELAALRVPDRGTLETAPTAARTLRQAAAEWRASRVDVSEGTRVFHRVSLGRLLPLLGDRRMDELGVEDLNEAIGALSTAGRKPATIRKSVQTLATLLSDYSVDPNVARGRRLRFPHERRPEIKPPTGEHVQAVHALLPRRYQLPLLVLDATGMRVGARVAHLGRRRRASLPLACLAGGEQDPQRPLGAGATGGLPGGARARPPRRPHRRTAGVSGVRRRPLPHRRRPRLPRCRRAHVQPARSPPPAHLASTPGRCSVGAHRRARRAAQALHDG
jgi:hypothetical protein